MRWFSLQSSPNPTCQQWQRMRQSSSKVLFDLGGCEEGRTNDTNADSEHGKLMKVGPIQRKNLLSCSERDTWEELTITEDESDEEETKNTEPEGAVHEWEFVRDGGGAANGLSPMEHFNWAKTIQYKASTRLMLLNIFQNIFSKQYSLKLTTKFPRSMNFGQRCLT